MERISAILESGSLYFDHIVENAESIRLSRANKAFPASIAELSLIDGTSLYDLLGNKASVRNFPVMSNDEMGLEQ
jgi:hypothetical protein